MSKFSICSEFDCEGQISSEFNLEIQILKPSPNQQGGAVGQLEGLVGEVCGGDLCAKLTVGTPPSPGGESAPSRPAFMDTGPGPTRPSFASALVLFFRSPFCPLFFLSSLSLSMMTQERERRSAPESMRD